MLPKKAYLLDTNIILRYLLNDHPDFSPKAQSVFDDIDQDNIKAIIIESVFTECVFVLEKFYKVPRLEISEKLSEILSMRGIMNIDKRLLQKALNDYAQKNVDIVDAVLGSKSSKTQKILSWDEDMKRLTQHYEVP